MKFLSNIRRLPKKRKSLRLNKPVVYEKKLPERQQYEMMKFYKVTIKDYTVDHIFQKDMLDKTFDELQMGKEAFIRYCNEKIGREGVKLTISYSGRRSDVVTGTVIIEYK